MKHDKTLPLWNDLPIVLRVRSTHGTAQYSREILLRSVLSSGIEPDQAVAVVHQVEKHFASDNKKTVPSRLIRNTAYKCLSNTASPDFAERYMLWRKFKKDKRPFILLLCGVPGVGKEALASSVAYRLGIQNVLNADTLANLSIRSGDSHKKVTKYTFTFLKQNGGYNVTDSSEENIITLFKEYAEQSTNILHTAIRSAVSNSINTIIHGASIIPGMLDIRRFHGDLVIVTATVALPDKNELKRRLNMDAGKNVSVKEVNALWTIQNFLTFLSTQSRVPVIQNVGLDSSIAKIMQFCSNYLKNRLSKSGDLEDTIDMLRMILADVHAPEHRRKASIL